MRALTPTAPKWTWASVNPGIRVIPDRSMTLPSEGRPMFSIEATRWMMPSSTSTLVPGLGSAPVPSIRVALCNIRVFIATVTSELG